MVQITKSYLGLDDFFLTIKFYSFTLQCRQECLKTEDQEEIPLDRVSGPCKDLWCKIAESGTPREQEPHMGH